jgi:hypothetical protein
MKAPIKIDEINIVPIQPLNGLLGFCSFVIDKKFYIGSVGIFSKREGGLRLVYPKKGVLNCCHPISREVGDFITKKITDHFYNLQFNDQVYGLTNSEART